jgi:hypothetical protein
MPQEAVWKKTFLDRNKLGMKRPSATIPQMYHNLIFRDIPILLL